MRIVEIGPSYTPVFQNSSVIKERLETGDSYLGIDCNPNHAGIIRNAGGEFMLANAQDLPVESSTADEIWVMNIFGQGFKFDPRSLVHGFRDGITKKEQIFQFDFQDNSYHSNESEDAIVEDYDKTFFELARILRSGGKIIIGELYTPAIEIRDRDYGRYGLEKEIFSGDRAKELAFQYGFDPNEYRNWTERDDRAFFLVLTKQDTAS